MAASGQQLPICNSPENPFESSLSTHLHFSTLGRHCPPPSAMPPLKYRIKHEGHQKINLTSVRPVLTCVDLPANVCLPNVS